MKMIHFDNIDSTNTYLKKNYHHLEDFQVISATHQTEGKGRLGNAWIDDGQSALFSILIKRKINIGIAPQISLIAVTATHQILSSYVNNILIKWPNDLLINNKKVAGILTESIIIDGKVSAIIVGIGVNVNNIEFSSSINQSATSIFIETLKELSISFIIEEISRKFEQEFILLEQGKSNFLSYFKKHSSILGKKISFIQDGIKCYATALDIKENGNLIVESSNGIIELNSGEIHLEK